jgi:hypothetical protein
MPDPDHLPSSPGPVADLSRARSTTRLLPRRSSAGGAAAGPRVPAGAVAAPERPSARTLLAVGIHLPAVQRLPRVHPGLMHASQAPW